MIDFYLFPFTQNLLLSYIVLSFKFHNIFWSKLLKKYKKKSGEMRIINYEIHSIFQISSIELSFKNIFKYYQVFLNGN